jgi:hypothetical protein
MAGKNFVSYDKKRSKRVGDAEDNKKNKWWGKSPQGLCGAGAFSKGFD